MNWFIKLFIQQFISDIVQNHKDCPTNWEVNSSTSIVENKKHKIKICFNTDLSNIYYVSVNDIIVYSSSLTLIERIYLCRYFKKLFIKKYDIPTKATKPEDFI